MSLRKQDTIKLSDQIVHKGWEKREEYYPDFVKLAEAYNVKGIRCAKPDDVKKTLQEMINHKGPVMCEMLTAPEENVMPMVPAGAALHEMLMA